MAERTRPERRRPGEVRLVTTVDGHAFDASEDVWRIPSLSHTCVVNLSILPGAAPGFREHVREFLSDFLVRGAPERAEHYVSNVRTLLRHVSQADPDRSITSLAAGDLLSYQASFPAGRDRRVGPLCDALASWASAGVDGLDADLIELLPQMEFERYEIGEAVRTASPTKGMLSKAEQQGLLQALQAGYENRSVGLESYAITLLINLLGLRPLQVALLKCRDLRTSVTLDGTVAHELWITRLKQGERPGTILMALDVVAGLATVIDLQRTASSSRAARFGLPAADAALFLPDNYGVRRPASLPGWEGHPTSAQIRNLFMRTVSKLKVRSDRTGEPLVAFPLRARRTMASVAAAAGFDLAVVSRLLTQSHAASALPYIQATPELLLEVDGAFGGRLGGLARAIQGGEPFDFATILPKRARRGGIDG